MTGPRSPRRAARRLATLLAGALLVVPAGAPFADGQEGEAAPDRDARRVTTTLGPVRAEVSLAPAEPVIGDTLALTIEVTAEPEIEVLMPAFGEALGRFVILDFTPRERLDDEGRTVHSQRYTLDVPMSGDWSVPPLVVEFVDRRPGERPAPEGEDAYELLTDAIEFTVASVLPQEAGSELVPPLGDLSPLPTRLERARPWIGSALIVLAVALGSTWLILRARLRGRRRSAYEIAIGRLRELQSRPRVTPEEIDRFYVELSGIVRRYLEDRFDIRAPESTTEEFLDRASRSHSLSDAHQELLVGFLRGADLVKFARTIPGDLEIAESVRAAEQFLEETREDAPMLEVDPEPRAAGERGAP